MEVVTTWEPAGLRAAMECVLFVAGEPIPPRRAAAALGVDEGLAVEVLEDLRLNPVAGSGLHVVRVAGGYQMCTRPEHAETVNRFLQPAAQRLSRQAKETLGRPILYATSDEFLKHFGLNDLSELPLLEESIAQEGRK